MFTDPWPIRGFELLLDAWSRVVEVDHRVVGYVFARFMADEAEILNLAIHPDYRRQGLGTILVRTAIQAARESGARKVFLEVRLSNHSARRFYEGLEFRKVGYRRGYYDRPPEDAMILCCELTDGAQPA